MFAPCRLVPEIPIASSRAKPLHPNAPKPDGRIERGQRRQTAFIEAARDLFIQHGYKGTTLEAIIARAGGSRETIYRAFGGKQGLFAAIIAEVGDDLAASIVAPGSLETPPREALTRLGLMLLSIWNSPEGSAVNRMVVSEGIAAPELLDAWYQYGFQPSIRAISRYLSAQTATGMLVGLDPVIVARQFVTLLIGEVAYPAITGRKGSQAASVARCVDLILLAYQPRHPEFQGPRDDSGTQVIR